jgi:hypothetical protein
MCIEPPLDNYKRFPKMVHWFNPWLLFRLLNNIATSSMFGKYADRRLIVAALDTVLPTDHIARATSIKEEFRPDANGAVWFDFVADLGDGFDSTFAVATLLAKKELSLGDVKLPRGQALVMGGDEVYPAATAGAYKNQLWQPYNWAFPDHDKTSNHVVPIFAIPGNHDWYDGLILFLAYFCREKPLHLGSWRSRQRRSYFAFQITETWWLWATDIQLADNMDQPQADYFKLIAANMPADSKIILCSAEPGWLYTDTNSKSWSIMDYAIGIAQEAEKGLTIPILISGDTHHYSRYVANDGTQFVTSGGGGAFLHPTHQLERNIHLQWLDGQKELTLGTIAVATENERTSAACYPSMRVSRNLTWRNLWFAFTNWDFSLLMGVIYWLVGIAISLRNQWDVYAFVVLIFCSSIIGYTTTQEKAHIIGATSEPEKSRGWTVVISSTLHAAVHIYVAIWFAQLFATWNAEYPFFEGAWYAGWIWLAVLLAQMGLIGFIIGSTIFGLNLLITCLCLRMNRNDAFSSFRLGGFNNFLRLRIQNEQLEVFVVGLDDVPNRDGWKSNPTKNPLQGAKRNPDVPIFVPKKALAPHLIETFTVQLETIDASQRKA